MKSRILVEEVAPAVIAAGVAFLLAYNPEIARGYAMAKAEQERGDAMQEHEWEELPAKQRQRVFFTVALAGSGFLAGFFWDRAVYQVQNILNGCGL